MAENNSIDPKERTKVVIRFVLSFLFILVSWIYKLILPKALDTLVLALIMFLIGLAGYALLLVTLCKAVEIGVIER